MTRNEIINDIRKRIDENCTTVDVDARYDEMLNDVYSLECVGGIFAHMQASKVLEACDPVAYRCGFSDYLDAEGDQVSDVNGCYYENSDIETEIREYAAELDQASSDVWEDDPEQGRMHEQDAQAAEALGYEDIRD